MKVFEVTLQQERTRPYRLLAQWILVVNLLFFLMMAVYERSNLAIGCAAFVGGITVAWILVAQLSRPHLLHYWMPLMLTATVTAHLISGRWWVSLTLLLLTLLYKIAMRPLVVKISTDRIEYPSVPRRHIAWSELNNIVLKDGLLTVDFRNNRLAQLRVSDEWYQNAANDEKVLNQFCSMQLAVVPITPGH